MKSRDLADLLLLAAIWGASFLLMRVAVPEFGPVALIEVRVAIAAAVLLPLVAWRGRWPQLRAHLGPALLVGVVNSALPFVLLAFALQTLNAGITSILNGMVPIWTALLAWVVLRQRVRGSQWLGLALGAVGVAVLVWDKLSWRPDTEAFAATLAVAACVAATVSYAVAAIFARKKLADTDPSAVAAGSQLGATLALPPLVFTAWPAATPSLNAWSATVALGVVCTAVAYLLYFRLLARIGAVNASSVTLLVPVFATIWGAIFLAEPITARLIIGGAIVLTGTALALGRVPRVAPKPSS
jgi:drug/metabolite transporter (DMT)-like permease